VFRRQLSARAGSDPSLIRLTVTDDDPHLAQTIAATWPSSMYPMWMISINNDPAQRYFLQSADEARQTLEAAEQN